MHPLDAAVVVDDVGVDDVATIVLCSKLCLFFKILLGQEKCSFLVLPNPTKLVIALVEVVGHAVEVGGDADEI